MHRNRQKLSTNTYVSAVTQRLEGHYVNREKEKNVVENIYGQKKQKTQLEKRKALI